MKPKNVKLTKVSGQPGGYQGTGVEDKIDVVEGLRTCKKSQREI